MRLRRFYPRNGLERPLTKVMGVKPRRSLVGGLYLQDFGRCWVHGLVRSFTQENARSSVSLWAGTSRYGLYYTRRALYYL